MATAITFFLSGGSMSKEHVVWISARFHAEALGNLATYFASGVVFFLMEVAHGQIRVAITSPTEEFG